MGKHAIKIFYLNLSGVQKQYIIIKCTDDLKSLFAFKKYHKNLVSVDFANTWPPAMWKTQRWKSVFLLLPFITDQAISGRKTGNCLQHLSPVISHLLLSDIIGSSYLMFCCKILGNGQKFFWITLGKSLNNHCSPAN